MNQSDINSPAKKACLARRAAAALLLGVLMLVAKRGFCADPPPIPEFEAKARYLLNFAKYVDWPEGTFAETNSAIRIGVLGDNKVGECLKTVAEGKTIGGRKIEVVCLASEEGGDIFEVLYISATAKKSQGDILNRLKTRPVLTVGETEQFTRQGGVINFVRKDEHIRFDIDLAAARQAKLEISSKMLSLANDVRGKP